MTRRAIALLLLSGAAFIALGYACLNRPHPMLVYNASTSVPKGWYRINAASPFKPGDWVLVRLPANASTLAMQRGYLPTTVPLLKPVAAVAPQRVCVEQQNVIVDGKDLRKSCETLRAIRRKQARAIRRTTIVLSGAANPLQPTSCGALHAP